MHVHEEEEIQAVRLDERRWLINGRIIPAVFGGAPKPGEKPSEEPEPGLTPAMTMAINAAVTSQLKRSLAHETKALSEELAQIRGLLQQRGDTAPSAGGGVSEAARLAEENAQLKRAAAEQKRALASERSDRVLRAQLEKRVKPEYIEAVVAMMRQRGDLVDTDDGARLSVTRARDGKGAAEKIDHDDLALAVDDWARTLEARAFLPAPSFPRRQASSVSSPRRRPTPRDPNDLDGMLRDTLDQLAPQQRSEFDGPRTSEPELRKTLEALERRGISLNGL